MGPPRVASCSMVAGPLAFPLSEVKALEAEQRTQVAVKFLKCESGFCENEEQASWLAGCCGSPCVRAAEAWAPAGLVGRPWEGHGWTLRVWTREACYSIRRSSREWAVGHPNWEFRREVWGGR